MGTILSFIQRPFKDNFVFFITLWFLLAISDCIVVNKTYGSYLDVISIAFLTSYLIVLLFHLLKINQSLFVLFTLYCVLIYDFFTLYVIYQFKATSIVDYVTIIVGSNFNETTEFISTYLGYKYILFSIISIFLISIIYYIFIKNSRHITYKILQYLPIFIIYPTFILINNPNYLFDTSTGKLLLIPHQLVNIPPNLKEHLTHPQIEETTDKHPDNIVIIIGESFNKTHSSLYEYDKETNPLLKERNMNNELIIFNNVKSPACHTIESFQNIMSTYNKNTHKKWYECTTIAEVFNSTDYNTIWISNQKKAGFYDNIPSKYAELCKESYFTNIEKNTYDEAVLPFLSSKNNYNLYFIHLMGQHVAFSERYPKEYDYFKEDDYAKMPQHQRLNRATYDNATRYNDYIVDSIISCFQDRESIIIYFSDHAIDIYQTDVNYCGHAIQNNKQSERIGTDIPFIIYMSPQYRANFPQKTNSILSNINQDFNTTNLIYTIMDIAGYKFRDSNEVAIYTLCKNPSAF